MKIISTEIEINASPERVWEVLTKFDAYSDWNPFIRKINGQQKVGEQLEAHLQPPDSREITFKPTLVKFEPQKELSWFGKLFIPGLFDRQHIFLIEEISQAKVRFIQKEHFWGILVPLLWRNLNPRLRTGFEQMNEAIKEIVEREHPTISIED